MSKKETVEEKLCFFCYSSSTRFLKAKNEKEGK